MPKKNRAAIYARFSSHNQREESIEIQVEKSREYCEAHALEVVRIYTDSAKTGRNTNRDGFQRMMEDAKSGIFDFVVIYKVTRIMRNRDEMAVARIMLRKAGVEILYAGETLGEGSTRIMHLGMLEVLAEYESAVNAERVRDGIAKNAERGLANGQVRYGWDIVDGRYQINEHEAAVMRKMRNMLFSGHTVTDIVLALKGELTHRGNPIGRNTAVRLLRREQNCGVYDYAGTRIEGGMPALWSRDDQDMIESILDRRHVPHRQIDSEQECPLSGKLWCMECGRAMIGVSGTSKSGKVYRYYKCRKCRRAHRREVVEEAVYDCIIESLGQQETRDRIADVLSLYWMDNPEPDAEAQRKAEASRIRKAIKEIDVAIENIWKAVESGNVLPGVSERMASLNQRKAELENELENLSDGEDDRVTLDHVRAWLDYARTDADPTDILNMFVGRIDICGDELRIYCNFDQIDPVCEDEKAEINENTRLEDGCSHDSKWRRTSSATRTLTTININGSRAHIDVAKDYFVVVTLFGK